MIAFLVDDISLPGGAERVICNVANLFVEELNKDVLIITTNKKNSNLFYNLNKNVLIINLNIYNTQKNKYIKKFEVIKKLKKIDKNYNIDKYFGVGTLNTLLLKLALIKKNIYAYEHIEYDAIKKILIPFRQIIYPKLKGIIVLTEIDKIKYLKLNDKVFLIPNFLSFYPKDSSSLNNKVILSIGRLTARKGFDYLIKSCNLIKEELKDWNVIIIGEGEEKEALYNLIKSYKLEEIIKIHLPTNNIIKYYENASIYVMPSLYEGFGMVLIEAMALGVPCISFNCPTGPGDIIKNNQDGFLVKEKNIMELSKCMKKLILDEELRKIFGKNAKKNVLRFSKERIKILWESLLCEEKK